MSIVAGIDESGLGPVLGPLVASAAAFSVPDAPADASLWRLLAGGVARRPGRRRAAVAVADSKRLYSPRGRAGLEHLERGVLSMLAARGAAPASLRELLVLLAPGASDRLGRYPWYAGADVPLPRCVGATSVRLSARAVAAAMRRAGVRFEAARCECVFVGEFNRLVGATRNKSTTAFHVASRLLASLCAAFPREDLRIVVDRQGGRMRYRAALELVFDGCPLKVLDETATASSYRIAAGGRQVEIRFLVDGERHHLPVALASMVSKYVRELFMGVLNAFWARRVPRIAPTAGYYQDGRRFYREIQPALRRLGVAESLLYRAR